MPQQNDPGFTFSSLLILAALGLFAWSSSPLQSARPTSEPKEAAAKVRDGEVPARLWQDPLDAIRRHAVMTRKQEIAVGARRSLSTEIADALTGQRGPEDELTVLLAPLTPGSCAEVEEGRRRRRYAILSALGAVHYVPRSAELLGLTRVRAMASRGGGYFLGGVLLAVLALFMVHQIRPRSGRVVLALSAVLVVGGALLLIAVATADGGEPLGSATVSASGPPSRSGSSPPRWRWCSFAPPCGGSIAAGRISTGAISTPTESSRSGIGG